MLKSVVLSNFKSFKKFRFSITDMNILVGTNNAGKSTLLDAIRVFAGAYRYASKKNPTALTIPNLGLKFGYIIPQSSIIINSDNVYLNCMEYPTTITYNFENDNRLVLFFHPDSPIYLYIDNTTEIIRTASNFRKIFDSKIIIIPPLGPLELEEHIYDKEYIKQWAFSHRASRFFRNTWLFETDNFNELKVLIEKTWPGMTIEMPEIDGDRVEMFCQENRMTREISWAGYGFQIWIQLISHILKSRNSDLIILDEPEVYLHADLQKKIVRLLRDLSSRVLMATHSVEIINDADPDEVIIIDKHRTHGQRLSNLKDLQKVSELMGSSHNIYLTKLAKGKKVLFVEGKDAKLLDKLARKAGYVDLLTNEYLTIVPIDGFCNWEKIVQTKWTFSNVLGENIEIMVLLDKDYRTPYEIDKITKSLNDKVFFAHILERKEIENYLLVPRALEETLLNAALKRHIVLDKTNGYTNMEDILLEITEPLKRSVLSQFTANGLKEKTDKSLDDSTIISDIIDWFQDNWDCLDKRLNIVPGKETVSNLNIYTQQKWSITITHCAIINNIHKEEMSKELIGFFDKLNCFVHA